jgi:ABC-type uncharacterized transport system substrate-binding protein
MPVGQTNRRAFVAGLGSAAAWPLMADAQKTASPILGYLHAGSASSFARPLVGFRNGLKAGGYTESENIMLEYRWAEGHSDRLPALAADLVQQRVAAIATGGAEFPVLAAKAATASIPIVFVAGGDPVKLGIVSSVAHPGANITGINILTSNLENKRFGLLRETTPKVQKFAVLVNPNRAVVQDQISEVKDAASRSGVDLVIVNASTESEFEPAFSRLVEQGAGAVQVCADPFFFSRRHALIALAARYRVPAIYEWRDFAEAGGLMSYGTDIADSYRQAGLYIARILNGDKPSDLPVMQTTRFEFVINLRTAKTLGLEIPPTVSARADEVIE